MTMSFTYIQLAIRLLFYFQLHNLFALQNSEIFCLIDSSIGSSERVTIILGMIPRDWSCFTEC